VAVVHADGVDLFFIALNAVGGADVITEDPGLACLGTAGEGEGGTTCEE
jgi:hypothetical protein